MSVSPNIIKDFEDFTEFFYTLTPIQRKIFWRLHSLIFKYEGSTYVSQKKLGILVNACRDYVNKMISRFCTLGVILKQYRSRCTCIYRLPEFLKIKNLKQMLKSRFSLDRHYSNTTQVLDSPTESLSRNDNDQKLSILEQFPEHLKTIARQDPIKAADFIGFSEQVFSSALESLNAYIAKHGIPRNEWGFMYKKCKELAKKTGTFNKKNWINKYKIFQMFGT